MDQAILEVTFTTLRLDTRLRWTSKGRATKKGTRLRWTSKGRATKKIKTCLDDETNLTV